MLRSLVRCLVDVLDIVVLPGCRLDPLSGLLISALLSFGGNYLAVRLSGLSNSSRLTSPHPRLRSDRDKLNISTSGGIVMVVTAVVCVLLCVDSSSPCIECMILILAGYGAVGLYDDHSKLIRGSGLSACRKYLWQSLMTVCAVVLLPGCGREVIKPRPHIDWGLGFLPGLVRPVFSYLVIIGTSNAVNLTDGLDGLAVVPVIFASLGLALLSAVSGDPILSDRFGLPSLCFAGDLLSTCLIVVGSGLGFLWFNAHPAQLFMGDAGSLTFGGIIGLIAVLIEHEALLPVIGFVFVLEVLSVVAQILSLRFRRRKILLMSPVHHHCELMGCPEEKIVVRFWIVSLASVIVAMSLLLRM